MHMLLKTQIIKHNISILTILKDGGDDFGNIKSVAKQ